MSSPTLKKAVKKSKSPASHPKYIDMVSAAIKELKERNGSSRQAILKYLMANYKLGNDIKPVNTHLKVTLRNASSKGVLKHVGKATGASGSFKLAEKTVVKKSPVKKTVKKPAATKKPSTKKAKSPKKKSPVKKSSKPVAKKTTSKPKPTSKKVAKKSSPKKSKK